MRFCSSASIFVSESVGLQRLICAVMISCRGQAEKEFRVEVEAIGRVRHKNLVRLLGYCAEGAHRYTASLFNFLSELWI